MSDRIEPLPLSRLATVLVVEDEHPLREGVTKILSRMGFLVIEAADGFAALEALRTPQRHIDVLVLDLTIPGPSSRQVFDDARRLRPEMSVIVTSAYGQDFATTSLQCPVQHFLRKPFRVRDLADLIGRAIS